MLRNEKTKYCLCCGVELENTHYGSFCKSCHTMNKVAQQRYNRVNNPFKAWVTNTIRRHKHNGYKVDIDKTSLEDIASTTTHCKLCGCKIKWNNSIIQDNSPSLDRVNNENHLNIDNIQIICVGCNRTKSSRTMDEFIKYCTRISKLYGGNHGT